MHMLMVATIRGMLHDQAVEITGRAPAQDQACLLDLLLVLTSYCGTGVLAPQAAGTPAETALTDLENALRDTDDKSAHQDRPAFSPNRSAPSPWAAAG
ncbi:hypothetical protein ACH4MA_03920 [Streptomyces roseolus]|uniref:hypothetical protein n=1 Tax=Streptomyces roseolus TaxID=67358 RepID=UPI0037A89629